MHLHVCGSSFLADNPSCWTLVITLPALERYLRDAAVGRAKCGCCTFSIVKATAAGQRSLLYWVHE
ncbi:hypothetical protein LR48_Vigan01g072900 [Vigna angularis]|uniref:Uncharacterized protein n=1 Tax=Phaseolus angularis TaxID=3914 RepID=A0A0L9TLY1_PHAAN|nr:hypothetical protein LR48_Vigan01g072900 [Vigna angularis]